MKTKSSEISILTIDIGGSSVKATMLNKEGQHVQEFRKVKTPNPASPENIVNAIVGLTKDFPPYDMVSVGFPGYVKKGTVHTAPNLSTPLWQNVDFVKLLSETLGQPVRLVNDADLHGLGVINGDGLEMVITLGTGFGTALFMDGILLPHLELGQFPATKGKTYDGYIGDIAFAEIGIERWNKRLEKVIGNLKTTFNYDWLYIGGGNAKKISFKLDDNITLVKNTDGIRGGARLWELPENLFKNA